MSNLILGIDAGNYKAKVAGPYGTDSFKTNICGWFKRDVDEKFGDDDMEFEIDSRPGFAGSIAQVEDEFGDGATYGDTKAHNDTKIRVLLAIHRYLEVYSFDVDTVQIVTGQPIANHNEDEKQKIIKMLEGKHKYTVNGKERKITITDVKVSPEGTGAFWSNPQSGLIRVLDIGSGTVNAVTLLDKKHIHKSSDTLNTGMETLKNKDDFEGIAKGIIQFTTKLKWKKNDVVLIAGGIAEVLTPYLKDYFKHAETIEPKLKRDINIQSVKPSYANAVGFYNLAKAVYK